MSVGPAAIARCGAWVYGAGMANIVDPELEAYAAAHSDPPSVLLEALREETFASRKDAGMQVGRLEGAFLRMLVRVSGARRVLEVGMFTGYSALCMAEGLPDDGELITCDIDPEAEKVARRHFAQSPQGKKIRIAMGPAIDTMGPAIDTMASLVAPFDLVFLDADKESYLAYYERALELLRPGGLVVADNTLWGGKVLKPESAADRGIVAFNTKVAADPRVDRVLVTVRDGIMLARKR
jgi:caffeoyl-CoA O-methyltransferase